jgi:hypothetical protein
MAFGRGRVLLAGLLASVLGTVGMGCDTDRPTDYGRQRPPLDELDPRDGGLQAPDVRQAADKVVQALLRSPELRNSDRQWTMVVTGVEDNTTDRRFRGINYDIFLQKLKASIAQQGRGQIQLIENRDRFYDTRSRELEGELEEDDEFGQGDGPRGPARAPRAISPDFGLYAEVFDLPNRGTTYYLMNFEVTNLRTRTLAFVDEYEVRVARER